jgi:hypothetical protein
MWQAVVLGKNLVAQRQVPQSRNPKDERDVEGNLKNVIQQH